MWMRRSHVYYALCGLALVMTSCDAGFPMGGGGYGRQGGYMQTGGYVGGMSVYDRTDPYYGQVGGSHYPVYPGGGYPGAGYPGGGYPGGYPGVYPPQGGYPGMYPPIMPPYVPPTVVVPREQESHNRGSSRVISEQSHDIGQSSRVGLPIVVGGTVG